MAIDIINLEEGRPTVDVAMQRLDYALRTSHIKRSKAIKIIHGYGSSGRGGAIKTQVHRRLTSWRNTGKIQVFVTGEEFTPFEESARKALQLCPELARDSDFTRCNHGITVVVL